MYLKNISREFFLYQKKVKDQKSNKFTLGMMTYKRKFNFLAIGKRTTSTKEMLLTQASLVVYLPKIDL